MKDGEVLAGELRDELVAAMQRVPELAGREIVLTALIGGITNRNFVVTRDDKRFVLRVPGKDTELLGIDRANEARAASLRLGLESASFLADHVALDLQRLAPGVQSVGVAMAAVDHHRRELHFMSDLRRQIDVVPRNDDEGGHRGVVAALCLGLCRDLRTVAVHVG